MDGITPARVADYIIDDLRKRERNGLIELPKREKFRAGEAVRVTQGVFNGHVGLFAGMRPRQRVEILLQLLGSVQRVTLAESDLEALHS
jgi:transcription antitermination factor NusG